MNTLELETTLNEEYKHLGIITITDWYVARVNLDEILYVSSIMDKITPSDNDQPIVIAKIDTYFSKEKNEYKVIDGYHRLKFYIQNGTESFPAIVLEEYTIERTKDNLFEAMQKLEGETITFLDTHIFSVGSKLYEIQENEGCGGCSNGWSKFTLMSKLLCKGISIETVEQKNEDDDCYELFINGKIFAEVDTGWGNGYYGGDFNIKIFN